MRAELKTKIKQFRHAFKKRKGGNFKPSFYQQYAGKIWSLKTSHVAQTQQ